MSVTHIDDRRNADLLVTYTVFPDKFAATRTEYTDVPWSEVVTRVMGPRLFPRKDACALLSMAAYGEQRTVHGGSLRHKDNVLQVFGCELDYDAGRVSLAEAVTLLKAANIKCVLHTSASHRTDTPRWRVIAPFGEPASLAQRKEYAGRVNRVLGGIVASESFTESLSWYVGRVQGVPFEWAEIQGRTVDEASDLEPLAFVKPDARQQVLLGGQQAAVDGPTDAELVRTITTAGEGLHDALMRLSARLISRGMSPMDTGQFLAGITHNDGSARVAERIREIPRLVSGAQQKYAQERDPPAAPMLDAVAAQIGLSTFTEIQPPPPFVIDGMLPLDVGLRSAPGGTSKSTLTIWEAIHIILGRPFLGRAILKQGPVLIVSAEDPKRRIKYRAHYIAQQMNLSEQDLETLAEKLLVEDMTGKIVRLAALAPDGNLYPTLFVDALIEAYRGVGLSLMVLDPHVLFGPGERLVNDGESIMTQVGARLVRELGCAVLFIAHSGKANARESRADQYSSRGGSALPDGMRMVQVLNVMTPKDTGLPDAVLPDDVAMGRILRLSIPKITDAPPFTEPFYLRRHQFGFEWIENGMRDSQAEGLHRVSVIQEFIRCELTNGVRHTSNTLQGCLKELGLSRDEVKSAVHAGLERGELAEKALPKKDCKGSRKTYLIVGTRV